MKYLKTNQVVPGKGFAWMYYELSDDMTLMRYVTHLPETGETELTAKPVVKRLFRPETLPESTAEEFEKYWSLGGKT